MIMGIAALVFIPLLAVSIACLLWAIGRTWPLRDREMLAMVLSGRPAGPRLPSRWLFLLAAVLALAAGVIALSLADETAGGATLNALGLLLGIIFLARGIAGYAPQWRAAYPAEPFASLDRKSYSPLALWVGAGFLLLVLLRLT